MRAGLQRHDIDRLQECSPLASESKFADSKVDLVVGDEHDLMRRILVIFVPNHWRIALSIGGVCLFLALGHGVGETGTSRSDVRTMVDEVLTEMSKRPTREPPCDSASRAGLCIYVCLCVHLCASETRLVPGSTTPRSERSRSTR